MIPQKRHCLGVQLLYPLPEKRLPREKDSSEPKLEPNRSGARAQSPWGPAAAATEGFPS